MVDTNESDAEDKDASDSDRNNEINQEN